MLLCAKENCRAEIEEGEGRDFYGQLLCDDCYMNALSPVRTCDPWAVRSASLAKEHGDTTEHGGSLQQKILDMIGKSGGLCIGELAAKLAVRPGDIEREIAALRHMEKIRSAMKDGKKIIVLW
ncbi:MAG: hypothetical protein K0A99_06820 [Desulfoarculaceae bacterium]|nr:hypothetical protein [Desulfoarculaceae bacterium]